MDIKHHTHPDQLETYSFWWSEVRLVVAAVSLLVGGFPVVFWLLPFGFGLTWPLLKLCWLITGLASLYLGYRWFTGGKRVFGGKKNKDLIAFGVSVVSGINLGLTGLLGANIGMRILSGRFIFAIVGVIYLVSAWYLYKRYNQHGKRVF